MNNTPTRASVFMLCLILYEIIVPVLLAPFIMSSTLSSDELECALLVLNHIIMFVPPIALYMLFTGSKLRDIMPLKPIAIKNVIVIVLLALLIQPYSAILVSITSFFAENTVSEAVMDDIAGYPFAVLVWSISIAPALFEEMVFRGIVLTNCKRLSCRKAIFVSSLFFGLMHLDFTQLFYTVPLGMFIALLVYYTGSIYAGMIAHFTINFSQILVAKVAMLAAPAEALAEEVLTYQDKMSSLMSSIFTAVIVTPFFVLLLVYFIRYNKGIDIGYKYDLSETNVCVELSQPKYKTKIVTPAFVIVLLVALAYILLTATKSGVSVV